MVRSREVGELLLGEWACLACLVQAPTHGFEVAARLEGSGDLGRVWSLSRPLTYRSIEQLQDRGLVEVVGEERGRTGGTRTIFSATGHGRELLDRWLVEPITHLRDARTELLLKVVVGDQLGRDRAPLLAAQRTAFAGVLSAPSASPSAATTADPVDVWREESAAAVARFLDRLDAEARHPVHDAP
ncbi:hypothetical protein BH10ACT1_BH10ACT1_13710 [soil metagenome]